MRQSIKLVSVGQHTRLGDILERALESVAFETVRSEDFAKQDWEKQKLLFAVSGDGFGQNEALQILTRGVLGGKCHLEGAVCAVVADAAQGGALHADVLKLLLALNGAGCAIVGRPCVEATRDLKNLSYETGDAGTPPFELYARQAQSLVERLTEFVPAKSDQKRLRFISALESEGAGHDWETALGREVSALGGALAGDGETADATLLLCENARNIPDEATLRMIDGLDACALSCVVASPRTGVDFYCMQILERACIQGACSLPPRAFTVCDGVSAVEALAVGAVFENVRRALAALLQ